MASREYILTLKVEKENLNMVSLKLDESKRKFRAKTGGNKRRSYTEGWMEFNDKKKAKYVAAAFNNQKIGIFLFFLVSKGKLIL